MKRLLATLSCDLRLQLRHFFLGHGFQIGVAFTGRQGLCFL